MRWPFLFRSWLGGSGLLGDVLRFGGLLLVVQTDSCWDVGLLKIDMIDHMVAAEMDALDLEMARVLGTDHPFLQELNARTMAKPGKRLRPKLLVLCSKMLGHKGNLAVRYSAVFELIHNATLIHDDIIDEAKTRRGQETLNRDLGNTLTVLYGDLLYTKAHTSAIEAGNFDIMHIITSVSERMIEGELLQHKVNYDVDITQDTYFDILKRKTAYLFAGTTKSAGLICNRTAAESEALYQFGFNFGISFQLIDDFLDYTADEKNLGKPVMQDLYEGKVTLPIIKLLQGDDGSLRQEIRAFWESKEKTVPAVLLERLRAEDGLQFTREQARHYAEKAVTYLQGFDSNLFTETLRALPIKLLDRMS